MFRKLAFALAFVGALGLPAQSRAADIPIKGIPIQYCRIIPLPGIGYKLLCLPDFNSSSSSILPGTASTGALIVTGFIGFVAALCAYDIYLKVTGQKNWDGSPKVAKVADHGHHSTH